MPPGAEPRLRTRDAVALGLLHGPAELLPISSSAHVALVPWLLGWPYAELDAEQRKAFEVALHAGTVAALLLGLRAQLGGELRALDRSGLRRLALSTAPPAFAGLAFEHAIEQRLGGPRSIAAGLAAGAAAMAAADVAGEAGRRRADGAGLRRLRLANAAGRRARRHAKAVGRRARRRADATDLDALLLGLAQACALWPGVSRTGATLTVARARGFARRDASVLSRHAALPVIAGGSLLKAARLTRRGLPPGAARGFAAGTAASFAATLASIKLVGALERDRSLLPYAAYRVALAAFVLRRLRTT
jgi:undecaprenyl-diphosphatase